MDFLLKLKKKIPTLPYKSKEKKKEEDEEEEEANMLITKEEKNKGKIK